uniref:RRM domain-containing protein n=1 Tax=Rhabditophanes sp. KR3021 TaxID=114890 RepID=A0AC35U3J4_9BILA
MESQEEENIEDQVTAGMTKQDDSGQDQKSSVRNIQQVVDAPITQVEDSSLEVSEESDSFVDEDNIDNYLSDEEEDRSSETPEESNDSIDEDDSATALSKNKEIKPSEGKKPHCRRNIRHTKNCNTMVNNVIDSNGRENMYKSLQEKDELGEFYVYALLSGKKMPKTIEEFLLRLFYIGKGTKDRMGAHYRYVRYECYCSNKKKMKHILDLLNNGEGFIGIKIVENLSETLSLVLESPLIDKYSKQLLNKSKVNISIPDILKLLKLITICYVVQ